MTTIKLTGDFSRGQRMAELFAEMEDAKAEHAKCRDARSAPNKVI